MAALQTFLDQLPWNLLIIACLTLGLAPFFPEPHIWEKLKMLVSGTLTKPIDIFDLLMHGAPFILALLKLVLGRGAAG
ncbi:RND transporter [Pseudooceanicola sp. MF1-13]|uniref:RND transporter n=1 Tax=Pseudooceanicola sp. MF1-13 TaxID=3379095 RepID=UPI0038929738